MAPIATASGRLLTIVYLPVCRSIAQPLGQLRNTYVICRCTIIVYTHECRLTVRIYWPEQSEFTGQSSQNQYSCYRHIVTKATRKRRPLEDDQRWRQLTLDYRRLCREPVSLLPYVVPCRRPSVDAFHWWRCCYAYLLLLNSLPVVGHSA